MVHQQLPPDGAQSPGLGSHLSAAAGTPSSQMSSTRLRTRLSADFDPYVQTLGAYYAQLDRYQTYIEALGETLNVDEVTDIA